MIDRIRDFFEELQIDWESWMWKNSPDRKELAGLKIAAHELALEEGRNSPYTHPEDYSDNWTPLKKLQPTR